MATANCTYGGLASYNGGYNPTSGYTKSADGYIGPGSGNASIGGYGSVIRITVPAAAGASGGRSLRVTLGLITLYYSSIRLEYWLTDAGRPDGVNYGVGPPAIKGNTLAHGIVNITGLNTSNYSDKTFTTASANLSANGGTYYLWLRSSGNAYIRGSSASLVLNYTATTKCSAPTSFSATPSPYEDQITLALSGAKGGVNNAITGYDMSYRISSNGSNWGSWVWWRTILTPNSSWSGNVEPPDVPRGYYLQIETCTVGTVSGYHSGAIASNAIRRNSGPSAPGYLNVSTQYLYSGDQLVLSWGGVGDSDGNISKYYIDKSVNSGAWTCIAEIYSSAGDGAQTITVGEPADSTIQYRICTQDVYGVVSGYTYSATVSVMRVITACSAPSVFAASPDIAESTVTLSWSGAKPGTNNAIRGYLIQYHEGNADGSLWESYKTVSTITSSATSGSVTINLPAEIDRGNPIEFRAITLGASGDAYNSAAKVSNRIKRNTIPGAPGNLAVSDSHPSLKDQITLSWTAAADSDNNLAGYHVYRSGALIATVAGLNTIINIDNSYQLLGNTDISVAAYDTYGLEGPWVLIQVYRLDKDLNYQASNTIKRVSAYADVGGRRRKISLYKDKGGSRIRLLAPKLSKQTETTVSAVGQSVSLATPVAGVAISGTLYATTTTAQLISISTSAQTAIIGKAMQGIKVSSGGNYTDASGQRWTCDTYDLTTKALTKRVNNGSAITAKTYSGADIDYPPDIVSTEGATDLRASGGTLSVSTKVVSS